MAFREPFDHSAKVEGDFYIIEDRVVDSPHKATEMHLRDAHRRKTGKRATSVELRYLIAVSSRYRGEPVQRFICGESPNNSAIEALQETTPGQRIAIKTDSGSVVNGEIAESSQYMEPRVNISFDRKTTPPTSVSVREDRISVRHPDMPAPTSEGVERVIIFPREDRPKFN